VEVTQAHYTELQKRLQEENPDRDSPEYEAFNHDVERIKLDVLGLTFSAEAFQPQHPDNNEGRAGDDEGPVTSNEGPRASNEDPGASNEYGFEMDEDDLDPSNKDGSEIDPDFLEERNEDVSDINLLFPFTLRFLDLSILDLKKALPDRLPSPLFFRQEYDDITALIKKEPKIVSVIVSGQPGTGEGPVSLCHRI